MAVVVVVVGVFCKQTHPDCKHRVRGDERQDTTGVAAVGSGWGDNPP